MTMTETSIAFIGGGNMATAIIGGLVAKGNNPNNIQVVEPSASQAEWLSTNFGINAVFANAKFLTSSHVVVLAVKPQLMQSVCKELSLLSWLKTTLVVSIAAGTTVESLSEWLGGHQRIVRTMPNTPALVSQGITGMVSSAEVSSSERSLAEALMQNVGSTLWFDNESDLNSVTAMSGSGPAYVFYLLEAMQAAGEQLGLSIEDSKRLALETFAGACTLAKASPDSFATLREKVTSKGGTTAAALRVMDDKKISESIALAVKAAHDRSVELGRST